MTINNALDMELKNMLRDELRILREYEAMFDSMTAEEKEDLRKWMANGRSVNSNPDYIYRENGCLEDFINARRVIEDMLAHPEQYRDSDEHVDVEVDQDEEMPF